MTDETPVEENESIEQPSVGEAREQWQVGIIGLPDSGKSTFLARLYGTLLGEDTPETSQFALSFPMAAEEEERAKALRDIQALWEWIQANFDEKKKTVIANDLTIDVFGRGLNNGVEIRTQDLPGEVFQSGCGSEAGQLMDATLKTMRKDFRKKHPNMHAALILVDSHMFSDPENVNLIKTMVKRLPRRSSLFREPFFRLVVMTKAATPEPVAGLDEQMAELRAQWKAQGDKWVDIVACESLADLERVVDAHGKIEYRLPAAEEIATNRGWPDWIRTPYSVMLDLPQMLVRYRFRRRWTRRLAAAAAILVLLGLWCGVGRWQDRRAFLEATDVTRISSETLRNYLVGSPANRRNLWYPFRHRKQKAAERWNECYFSEDPKRSPLPAMDYEKQRELLEELRRDAVWPYVDEAKFKPRKGGLDDRMTTLRQGFDRELESWRERVVQSENPAQEAHQFNRQAYTAMPSLILQFETTRDKLLSKHATETSDVAQFTRLVDQWQGNVEALIKALQAMATDPQLSFNTLVDKRARDVRSLVNGIRNTGIEHRPHASDRLLTALTVMLERRGGPAFPSTDELTDARTRVTDELNRIERMNTDRLAELVSTQDWHAKIQLCEQTRAEMKDTPRRPEWEARHREWIDKWSASAHGWEERQREVAEKNMEPHEQIKLLKAFEDGPEGVHAPEHRREAQQRRSGLEREIEGFNARDREYVASLGGAETWSERITICERAKAELTRKPWSETWTERHAEWTGRLGESQKLWRGCREAVQQKAREPHRQVELLTEFIGNEKGLHAPEHLSEASNRREEIKRSIEEQDRLDADFRQKLETATLWRDRRAVCEEAKGRLRFEPWSGQWGVLLAEWTARITKSEELWRQCLKSVDESDEVPAEQKRLLDAFIGDAGGAHAPEHINTARERLAIVESSIRVMEARDRELRQELDNTTDWGGKLNICKRAGGVLSLKPWALDWQRRQNEWAGRLKQSQERWADGERQIGTKADDPWEQRRLVDAYVQDTEGHAPEHRKRAEEKQDELSQQISEIEKAWSEVRGAESAFDQDPKSLPDLEGKLTRYRNVLLGQRREAIAAHRAQVEEMDQKISNERKKVGELVATHDQRKAAIAGEKASDKRREIRRELADVLEAFLKTYENRNTRETRIPNWWAEIKAKADDLILAVPISNDDIFAEILDALTLVRERAGRLGLAQADVNWANQSQEEIRTKWAEVRWEKAKSDADTAARRGRYAEAIKGLFEYKDRKAGYAVWADEADREITRHTVEWERVIIQQIGDLTGTPFGQKGDYTDRKKKVAEVLDEYQAVLTLSSELIESRTKANEKLNRELLGWYTRRIDELLSNLQSHPDGRRILTKWPEVKNLETPLREFQDDQDVLFFNSAEQEKARLILKRLAKMKETQKLRIGFSSVSITTPNDGKYLGSKYPEPTLSLMKRNNQLVWRVELENDAPSNSAEDTKQRDRSYQVKEESGLKRFVITANDWAKELTGHDDILYSPEGKLSLELSVLRQITGALELVLVNSDETPGILLSEQGKKKKYGMVKCKTAVRGKEFEMHLELEVTVVVPGAEIFVIPSTFANWPLPSPP